MGWLEDIRAADPVDRPRLRAEAIASLGPQVGQSIVRGNFRLTLTDGPRLLGRILEFSVRVNRIDTGADVTPPALNPIRVVNPPVLVPDPAGSVDLGPRGMHRFDLLAALLQIVRDLR